MKRQYLYVYVCRKHVGWGRHYGYTGVTNSPWHRDQRHRTAQPWSDLIVKRHLIPLGRCPRFVALGLEKVLILATRPIYNVQCNRWNPRRITPRAARLQRAARDGARRSPTALRVAARLATYRPTRFTLVPVVTFVVAAFMLWSR